MNNRIIKKILLGAFVCPFFLTQAYAQSEICDQNENLSSFSNDYEELIWDKLEYLYWQVKNSPEPVPLVATAPFIANLSPVLGEPGATVVLGGESVHTGWRSGAKFTYGRWLDDCNTLGAEVNYFFLLNASKKDSVFSSGSPDSIYLSVPFFDTTTGSESSSPVAAPDEFQGYASLKISNGMQGAELNIINNLCASCDYQVSLLAGFRYINFRENLKFFVDSPSVDIPTEVYEVTDHFHTQNNFYAGQVGFIVNSSYNCFSFKAQAKIALGAMCERASIHGKFVTNAFNGFGEPQTFEGGYFALPSNIGHYSKTCFAVAPEINLSMGYQVCDDLRLTLGYSFLYINKILWAGKQMNRNINPTQSALYEFTANPVLVGEDRPIAKLKNDSFWAQGLIVGIEFSH